MKEYPSILSAADLLARSDDYLGRPFVAFDKLDGSNIRAEWDRQKGWNAERRLHPRVRDRRGRTTRAGRSCCRP
jgi:hypothetical protein